MQSLKYENVLLEFTTCRDQFTTFLLLSRSKICKDMLKYAREIKNQKNENPLKIKEIRRK